MGSADVRILYVVYCPEEAQTLTSLLCACVLICVTLAGFLPSQAGVVIKLLMLLFPEGISPNLRKRKKRGKKTNMLL